MRALPPRPMKLRSKMGLICPILQVGFGLGYRDLGGLEFAALHVELKLSGILSPLRYENDKHQNRFEDVRQKIYMLFSKQPQEIVQAVTRFKNANYPQ